MSEHCVILTNSRRPWVSDCVARFAPNLEATFNRQDIKIIYARETLQRQRRGSNAFNGQTRGLPVKHVHAEVQHQELEETLTKAKLVSMQQQAMEMYSQYPGQTWKNILSIGDSKYERDAAWEMAFQRKAPKREQLRMKTIVTPLCPSIQDLTYHLGFARFLCLAYVKFDGDFDIDMNTPDPLHAVAKTLGMPELPSSVREFPIRDEDEEAFLDDFDELALWVHDRAARQMSEAYPYEDHTLQHLSKVNHSGSFFQNGSDELMIGS